MFLNAEGPLLISSLAFPQTEKGVTTEKFWQFLFGCLEFSLSRRNILFLTELTDEQNTQHSTETLSQPISQNVTAKRSLTPGPSPIGEGSDYRDTPICPPYDSYVFSSYQQANRGNLTYYSPLQSERGWGWGLCDLCMPEAFCGIETVRKKVLLNLWVLWEKEISSIKEMTPHDSQVRSISHRKTQMNRTHSIPQRH